MSTTVRGGGLIVKDPNSVEPLTFDWDTEHLPAAVTITSSEFFISGTDAVLTKDNEGILPGSRTTQVRLLAGTLGVKYTLTNRVITDQSPTATKDQSIKVLIQQR